jgi:hypothetical protein
MDLSKYPLEKFFFFVAGIIPGFVALLIFQLAAPGSFDWFFTLGFLGYKTKLSVILITAFIVGNSLTTFLNSILGAVGGFMGHREAQKPFQPPHTQGVAPWRDIRWRVALRERLGAQTPNDTILISEQMFNLKREGLDFMPEVERPVALANLNRERLDTEMDDLKWSQWYDHYHQKILTGRNRWDVQGYVQHGLVFNLETAAVYTLLSAPLVPAVRHWWCILPAAMWSLILVAQLYSGMSDFRNPWTTLSKQIEYLSEGDSSAEFFVRTPKD